MADGPTLASGKLCYLQIPATDIPGSADFYESVFGWRIRRRDGEIAFDDTTGEVSGSWVSGRQPQGDPGLLIYVMVSDIERAIEAIVAGGGEIVQPVGADAPEVTARFRDPAGNVFGLYEDPNLRAAGERGPDQASPSPAA
jgi:predicted enzyme related to lactoylglutathione lyase